MEKEIDGRKFKFSKMPILEAYQVNGLYRAAEAQKKPVVDEETIFKVMETVSFVRDDGQEVKLDNRLTVNSIIPSLGLLAEIEKEALRQNGIAPLQVNTASFMDFLGEMMAGAKPLLDKVNEQIREGVKGAE